MGHRQSTGQQPIRRTDLRYRRHAVITIGGPTSIVRGEMLMKLRRMRQDIDHLNSWLLLVVTAGTIGTGLVVQLWDLHGFTWHTYLGYALIVTVVIHVLLNSRQLFAYTGFRLRRGIRAIHGGARKAPLYALAPVEKQPAKHPSSLVTSHQRKHLR